MPERDDVLPSIETWWPHLTVGARHEVLSDTAAPLDDRVVKEIERICDTQLEHRPRLSDDDRHFIATQGETVD